MSRDRIPESHQLTGFDRHLITRIAYAMVVSGLWTRIAARHGDEFDYYEIVDVAGRARYRAGRLADGKYVLLDLRSGLRKSGDSLTEVLRQIVFVPSTIDSRPVSRP